MSESYKVGDRFKINEGLREFEIQGKIPLREYAKIHNIEAPTVKTEYLDPDKITEEEKKIVADYHEKIRKILITEKKEADFIDNNIPIKELIEKLKVKGEEYRGKYEDLGELTLPNNSYLDPDEIMYEIQFLPTKEESDKVLEYLRKIKIKLEEEKIKLEGKKWFNSSRWFNNNSSITKLNENLAEIAHYTHYIDVPQPLELLIRNLNVLGKRYGLGKLTTGRIDTDYLDAKTINESSSPAVGGAKRRRRTTKRRKNKRKRRKTR